MSEKWAGNLLLPVMLLVALLVYFSALPSGVQAQAQNGITTPAHGDVVSGILVIEGTADHPNFLRYELAFLPAFTLGADWIAFAQGEQPVVEGTLAIWDTTVGGELSPVFPDGRYRLRLRVVREDYNYDEYFVTDLVITNSNLTPTITPTITATVESAIATPLSSTDVAATLQAGAGILPTLTPFPTPSPRATLVDALLGPPDAGDGNTQEERRGLLAQLTGIEMDRFSRAFWFGAKVAAYVFAALAFYLLIRGLLRWLRRKIRL